MEKIRKKKRITQMGSNIASFSTPTNSLAIKNRYIIYGFYFILYSYFNSREFIIIGVIGLSFISVLTS